MTVVAASGFRAAGTACGIKASGEPDLALIAADEAVPAAAVFTTSATAAPPVHLCRERIAAGRVRAVVANSGSANAGTGTAGYADAVAMGAAAATELGCPEGEVLVSSTGPIGGRLPLGRITSALPGLAGKLGDTDEHGWAAARAIMTTDSVPKGTVVDAGGFTVGGIAKGAGMLRPNMATMLAYLTTDAIAEPGELQRVLARAVDVTFNCLNVDGCQSTNDTVVLMASGDSGVHPELSELERAVETACTDLAWQLAQDAEGATKAVRIEITGARSEVEARRLGMTVADSDLVRSSFYGADPNWGRVLAALGVAGVPVDPDKVSIAYDGTEICHGGVYRPVDEDELSDRLVGDFTVDISVGDGPGRASIVTTDLTPDYVRFNGERS